MLHISFELTGIVAVALPVAALATYVFRIAMQRIFRLIRDSVSALNQYMQEDLSGIDVVQLSGRESYNISEYRQLNQENKRQEFRAINYEVIYETFNTSLASPGSAGTGSAWCNGTVHTIGQHDDQPCCCSWTTVQHTFPIHGLRRTNLPGTGLGRTSSRTRQARQATPSTLWTCVVS